MGMSVRLTAADHDQNGFVHVAQWRFDDEASARHFISEADRRVTDESEPDIKSDPFTFILDLCDGWDMIDNSERCLPTQVAMQLAPEQVQAWLNERPEPDFVIDRPIPTLALSSEVTP